MPGYDLNTESINSFVDDSQIELPRFQRKLTWTDEDNFKLCLSVFKGYPLGVIVLSKDDDIKYLLDGRQRRHALNEMRNPESVYDWSRAAIGFNLGVSEDELREQYWEFVDDYFGEEEEDEDGSTIENQDSGNVVDDRVGENIETEIANSSEHAEDENLIRLLDLILTVHPKRARSSGLTKPFDFRDKIEGLDYLINPPNGNRYIDTNQLLDWIEYRAGGQRTPDLEYFDKETFYGWLMRGKTAGEGDNSTETTIKKEIDRNWQQIVSALQALDNLDTTLRNRKIGYMEVRDATANDEKKIFEIINSEGTDLTAVEILSAKPAYNIEIDNPSEDIERDIEQLYQVEMDVTQEDAVRWDRPATLYNRLDIETILPQNGYGFERRVRIGFKIMSGYYLGGISKNDFEKLAKEDISWGATELEQKINNMETKLVGHPLLKFWEDWADPLVRMTSEAVSINYILCSLKYWESLGMPTRSGSAKLDKFQNKGAVLFDRMIYEYITRIWSGSGDTRIASNLTKISDESSLFKPVDSDEWESLLTDLIENGQIEGQDQLNNKNPSSRVKLLLRYYYIVTQQRPTSPNEMSVDHIIPSKEFESSVEEDLQRYEHHIGNLAELPSRDNSTKGDKSLDEITDPWLKSQISQYTGIDENDFGEYCDITDIEKLVEDRSERIKEAFLEGRRNLLDVQ